MHIYEFPNEMLEEVASHLSYDDLAKCRLVSRRFNAVCSSLLNRGAISTMKLLEEDDHQFYQTKPRGSVKSQSLVTWRKNRSILHMIIWSLCDVMAEYRKYYLLGKYPFIAGKVNAHSDFRTKGLGAY